MSEMTSPAANAAAITLDDTTEYKTIRAIYLGGTGDLKVTMIGGGVVTFTALPVGALLPIRAKILWSTGSTASATLKVVALS